MARPRPECARHPRSRVWFDGTYGRPGRRRQRFKCVPRTGERRHVFTELLPRTIAEDHECLECERPLAPHEGPPAPRYFEFTTRQIAQALIDVGAGVTYRRAGRNLRELADRTNGRYSRFDGSNIADWVELFAPAIFHVYRLREWTSLVMLDALPFSISGHALNQLGHPRQGGSPAFHVFGAMGYYRFRETKLLGLEAFPGFGFNQGRPSWVEFLRSLNEQLEGAPRQIVCDSDRNLLAAIDEVWPSSAPGSPTVFICHHHLRDSLTEKLRDAQLAADDPLYVAALNAFKSPADLNAFELLAQAQRPPIRTVTSWLRRNGETAAYQVAHAHGHVTNTGPLETYFSELRHQLDDRRGGLTNRPRLNQMLMLMMLNQRQVPRPTDYAKIIRDYLADNAGRAGRRRQIDDPRGHPSL